jgi:menaquinone-dependent protoporphyrinogen oxidase
MADRTALILYATRHGHTARIAGRVAQTLGRRGVWPDVWQLREAVEQPAGAYDGVILAAPVHDGRHDPAVAAYARRHAAELARRPNAFLSVSLSAADDAAESRAETERAIAAFLRESGWTPRFVLPVGGMLEYGDYDATARLALRLMARRYGHPADAWRDHDFTDWAELGRFAEAFAASLLREPVATRG